MSTVTLREVVSVSGGGTPRKSAPRYYGGGIPWVTPKDMKRPVIGESKITLTAEGVKNSTAKLIPAGSVLVVVRSGVLKHTLPVALTSRPVTVNQDMKALVPSAALDAAYLARLLKAWQPRVLTWVRATTADNFPIESLLDLKVVLPSLSEQRRIAAILDQADAIRIKRGEILHHFGSLAQSIFHDMFGDPVSNSKDWPKVQLGEKLILQQYGPRFYDESYTSDGVRIARITDLTSAGALDFSTMPRLRVSSTDRDKFLLQTGDVLFARTGATVGKVALIQDGDPECIAGAYFIRMRFAGDIDPVYVSTLLRTEPIQAIVLAGSHQSAQQNFSGPGLRSLPLTIPPLELQRTFRSRIARINAGSAVTIRAMAADDELFASLQSRAFRGEL